MDERAGEMVFGPGIPCIACGYDLDGRPVESVCPECGRAAAETLESASLLPEEHLSRVKRGLRQAMAAAAIGPALYIGGMLVAGLGGQSDPGGLVCCVSLALPVGPVLAAFGLAQACGMPLRVGDSGTLFAPGSWAAPRGVSLSVGGYAVCFGGTIVLLWLTRGGAWAEPLAIAIGLAAALAWCIRNWVVLPHLRRMEWRCNAGRTAAAIGLLRWIPAALGVLFGMIAAVFLIDSRDGLGWVGAGVAMAAWLLGLGWMAAWVVLLFVLARAVGRMQRRVKGRRGPGLRPAALKVD